MQLSRKDEERFIALVHSSEVARKTTEKIFKKYGFSLKTCKNMFLTENHYHLFCSAFVTNQVDWLLKNGVSLKELSDIYTIEVTENFDDFDGPSKTYVSFEVQTKSYLKDAMISALKKEDPDSLKEWVSNLKKINTIAQE